MKCTQKELDKGIVDGSIKECTTLGEALEAIKEIKKAKYDEDALNAIYNFRNSKMKCRCGCNH